MTNSRGETVGDMIVRERYEQMARSPKLADEIAKRPTPRSIRNAVWPPVRRKAK